MSYHLYVQHMQQLMAMGVYNVPMNVPIYPFLPNFTPIQNVQTTSLPWSENVIEESDDVNERTLFCANLHKNVSDEMLYELFIQAGPIQNVNIPKDKYGKSRLFGFVTYKYRSCPQYALRLVQGVALFGQTLDIKFQGKYNLNGRK